MTAGTDAGGTHSHCVELPDVGGAGPDVAVSLPCALGRACPQVAATEAAVELHRAVRDLDMDVRRNLVLRETWIAKRLASIVRLSSARPPP